MHILILLNDTLACFMLAISCAVGIRLSLSRTFKWFMVIGIIIILAHAQAYIFFGSEPQTKIIEFFAAKEFFYGIISVLLTTIIAFSIWINFVGAVLLCLLLLDNKKETNNTLQFFKLFDTKLNNFLKFHI